MATGQVIPGVSNNELIRTTWGNFVANELNVNSVKLNGLVPGPAGPSATPQVMTGALYIRPAGSAAALRLQNGSNTPAMQWESTVGVRYAHAQAATTGLIIAADVGTIRLLLGTVEVAELASGLFKVTGTGRFGIATPTGDSLQVYGTDSAGITGNAHIGFYPSATNADTMGARGAYVGFLGEGMQVQADIGNLHCQSVSGTASLEGSTAVVDGANTVSLDGGTDIRFTTGGTFRGMITSNAFLWSKAASDFANAGVEILGVGSAEGTIFTTIDDAATRNVYCRHEGAANADTKHFITFYAGSTQVGRIEQDSTTGISLLDGSDYRLKTVVGPIVDAVDRVKALRPVRVTWNDDPARGETDAFLAHEVATVVPAAVSGVKDEVDDDGNPVMQGLDYSKLVTVTVAGLQALIGQVEALTARVAQLEEATP